MSRSGKVTFKDVRDVIACGQKNHLEEAAQSFIDDHLDSLNLLRKHIWGGGKKKKIINTFSVLTCSVIVRLLNISNSKQFIFQVMGKYLTQFTKNSTREILLLRHENLLVT